MDTISDILSAFFVNTSSSTKKDKKRKPKIKKLDKETQFESILENSDIEQTKQTQVEAQVQTQVEAQVQTYLEPQEQTQVEPQEQPQVEPQEQPQVEPEEQTQVEPQEQSQEQPEVEPEEQTQVEPEEQTQEDLKSSYTNSETNSSISNTSKSSTTSTTSKSSTTSTTSKSSTTSNSSSKPYSTSRSSNSDTYSYTSEEPTSHKSDFKIKRCSSKNDHFISNNLLFMNKDLNINLKMLNEILYDHSLIDGCKDKFDKCIYVFSNNSNKLEFKNMFDNNPYLYFTEIKISSKLTINTLKEFKKRDKELIIIIDGSIDTHIISDIIDKISDLNVHLLYLTSNYSSSLFKKLRNKFDKELILLHKNTKHTTNEKKFYKNIIEKYFSNVNFIDYFENLDKIMLNNNILKYF